MEPKPLTLVNHSFFSAVNNVFKIYTSTGDVDSELAYYSWAVPKSIGTCWLEWAKH